MAVDDTSGKPADPSVTVLLRNWQQGDSSALAQVALLVDRELHRLASAYLKRERPGHTLQPTALVNEAYLRLLGRGDRQDWESRSHFIAIAAQQMRQILVDYARRHRATKRGAGATLIPLDEIRGGQVHEAQSGASAKSVDLLALDEALAKLAAFDARKARAMELKFFGGLEMKEIASVLKVSLRTAEKDVRLGTAWLRSALSMTPPGL
jgi:RNA polymerase sigma-70 factor (ECF subfamily)